MKIYNTTDSFWIDESGVSIPFSRVTDLEKLKEKSAFKILKDAQKINKQLFDFKKMLIEQCEKTFKADLAAGKVAEDGKGNYTLYSFDRSVKISLKITEPITFDENILGAAKEKLEAFLKVGTNGVDEMIKEMILQAFSSDKKTKQDANAILSLKKYKERINQLKYPEFHEAMDLIDQAIRKPQSKKYYQIWLRDDQGEYELVDLNLSSI